MIETDRWGVWCEAPKYMFGATESQWASGPDGTLVLYETVAKHLAEHFNDVLPHIKHTARRLVDGPPEQEDDDE